MRAHRLILVSIAAVLLWPRSSVAADFVVYAVKAKLPVEQVEVGSFLDTVVERTIKQNEIVNLALGRSPSTKVDKTTEILGLAVETGVVDPRLKLVVFDPTKAGAARVTTVVANAGVVDFESGVVKNKPQGQGTGTADVQETSLGDPSSFALHSSTVSLTGFGKGAPGADSKLTVKAQVAGRLSFTDTQDGSTTRIDGFVVNGKASVAGKPVGVYSE